MDVPEAPLPRPDASNSRGQASPQEGLASVSGTVIDQTGATVAGAQVCLARADGTTLHTLVSGTHGEFTFIGLPPGSYLVRVDAQGFATFTSSVFRLVADQSYQVPAMALAVGGAVTEVTVRPTELVAAEQMKAEEKQRVLWIAPAFYISFLPDAAPLTSKQKFSLAAHDTFDWTSFVGTSIAAGLEQAHNSFAGYGQGAAGYGKRWAASYADGLTSDLLSHFVFASLLHQDPRYFYQGTGTLKSRLYHAVSYALVARSDSGKAMPNYSYLFAAMCSGALANAYYPRANRGAHLVFTDAALDVAGRAGQAVLEEFLAKKFVKHIPAPHSPSNGQPAPPATVHPY